MSRGIGQLQPLILDLMATRHGVENIGSTIQVRPDRVIGGDFVERRADRGRTCNYGFYLAAGIHDMRQVIREVFTDKAGQPREKRGLMGGTIPNRVKPTDADKAAFSRAVRQLDKRGLIEFPSLVPLFKDEIGVAHRTYLADGIFLPMRGTKQRRFARLALS